MWMIEAFRSDDDELEWEVDLTGVNQETLESRLELDDITIPAAYPLTANKARIAVSEFGKEKLDESFFDENRLEFFLTEFADE